MADFVIKAGDVRPILTDTLTYSDGTSPNLSGATVQFVMRSLTASAPAFTASATITSSMSPATVSFTYSATQSATPGQYLGSWLVTFSDNSTMTFPTVGYIDITIEESLTSTSLPTSIVSLAEVKDYLTIPSTDRSHDNKLAFYLTATVPVIENIVGPCVPQLFEEWHDGGSLAIVPRHRPVIALEAVSFYIGPVEYVAVQVGTPAQGQIYSCELDMAGRVVRRGPGGSVMAFPTGLQAVHVVYQAGRSPIPDNIKMANLELIRANYQITQQAGGRPDPDEDILDRMAMSFMVPGRVRELLQSSRRAPSLA